MKPHKHAELIHAWADGATIQSTGLIGSPTHTLVWEDDKNPRWSEYYEYRIKPEPKPYYFMCIPLEQWGIFIDDYNDYVTGNDKIPFSVLRTSLDAMLETGELKSAEVLK